MDVRETIKRLKNGDLSRRDFNKALAATGIATVTMPVVSSRADEDQAIYYTWSGYDIPEVFPAYVEKHGVMPELPIFGDIEEAFQKVRTGYTVDIMHPCSSNVVRFRDAGVIQAIDTALMPNWNDVIPSLQSLNGTVFEEGNFFVPFDWGQTSITYRTDLVDLEGEEESWGILWDERYAGRLAIIDAAEDSWWCAAIYAGVDTDNLTDDDLKIVFDLMMEQQPLLLYRQSDMTTVEQSLASGELVAAMTWNSTPLTLHSEGVPVRFANPKEGALTWVCGMVLTSNAPNYEKAHDLLDALIAPEVGKFLIEEYGYGHASASAFDLVSQEQLAARGLSKNPDDVLGAGVFIESVPVDIEQKINRDWAELIALG